MVLESELNDRVNLIKQDGSGYSNLRASVQEDKIFVTDADLPVDVPIEEGDTFERILKSVVTERYTVLESGFYSERHGMPGYYQSEVRRESRSETELRTVENVKYNVTGPDARVKIQSTDRSTNLVDVGPDELFDELRAVLEANVEDQDVVQELVEMVDALERSQGSDEYTRRYRDFMTSGADHVESLAPFIPALSQMIGSG